MGVGATFWTTFSRNVTKESEEWATFLDQRAQVLRTFSETPSAPRLGSLPRGRGSMPGGRPDRRVAEGGHFSPEK